MSRLVAVKIVYVVIMLLTVTACARLTVVNINAITDPGMPEYGHRYFLTNDNKNAANNDLYFKEFRHYFDYLLQKQGYTRVNARNDADIEIRFHYGVSDGRTAVQTFSWPIYESFGGDAYTVTEKITDSVGNVSTVRRTVYIPPYIRQVGNSFETSSYTLFTRFADLAAYPANPSENKTLTPIWSVNVYSVGDSDDLRAVMPYLAAASSPFLGKNSVTQRVINLQDSDPLLIELRNLAKTTH